MWKQIIGLAMAATLVASTPVMANDLLAFQKGGSSGGKGGSSGGGNSGGGKGGGSAPPSKPPQNNGGGNSGGGRGGGSNPPSQPPRNTGGGGGQNSGGGKGGGSKPPTQPPRNNGGSSGGNSGGKGGSNPPSQPPRNNGGGQNSGGDRGNNPPIRGNGGGQSTGGGKGSSNSSGGGRVTGGGSSQSGGSYGGTIRGGSNSGSWSGGRTTSSGNTTGKGPSRSGNVSYNSVSNMRRDDSRNRQQIYNAPSWANGKIGREVRNSDNIRRNDNNRYRSGYYHYDTRWVDNNFCYPYYRFSYTPDCYPSPFYYYGHLPAYVTYTRIQIGGITFDFRSGSSYRWRQVRYDDWGRYDWGYNSNQNDADLAVSDIREAFRRGSARFISNMIPRNGRITAELEDNGRYTLSADDFYDMMQDLVEGTRTHDYAIEDVRVNRNQLTIVARHDFEDAWGGNDRVYHTYGLEKTRYGYEIVFFRTDRNHW